MDKMLDGVARILASPISRRDAFRKIAAVVGTAAMWAVVGKQDVGAASCASCCAPAKNCPQGIECCAPFKDPGPGNSGAACRIAGTSGQCCSKGSCICPDGNGGTICSSSKGAACNSAAGCVHA
jgi:hypothetical protein